MIYSPKVRASALKAGSGNNSCLLWSSPGLKAFPRFLVAVDLKQQPQKKKNPEAGSARFCWRGKEDSLHFCRALCPWFIRDVIWWCQSCKPLPLQLWMLFFRMSQDFSNLLACFVADPCKRAQQWKCRYQQWRWGDRLEEQVLLNVLLYHQSPSTAPFFSLQNKPLCPFLTLNRCFVPHLNKLLSPFVFFCLGQLAYYNFLNMYRKIISVTSFFNVPAQLTTTFWLYYSPVPPDIKT